MLLYFYALSEWGHNSTYFISEVVERYEYDRCAKH